MSENVSTSTRSNPSASSSRRQGIYWLLTIPRSDYQSPGSLPDSLQWIKGQQERGGTTGFEHWQICCAFRSKQSLAGVKKLFGSSCHAELSRSSAAGEYVWKDETSVPGTRFEWGSPPIVRNRKHDWDAIWESAKLGQLDSIPASVRVQSYGRLRQIAGDYDVPRAMVRQCVVFWGDTGTGKSRRAWEEAGLDAYSKDPRTKFWCGYSGQKHAVIDEFRGNLDVSHLLRWLDRYPVRVELKGSSRALNVEKFWITSNLNPRDWYPELDEETKKALLRRMDITHFTKLI